MRIGPFVREREHFMKLLLFAQRVSAMSHEIAKSMLERADSLSQRGDAVKSAMDLGMTLREIEEYLDWLDMINQQLSD